MFSYETCNIRNLRFANFSLSDYIHKDNDFYFKSTKISAKWRERGHRVKGIGVTWILEGVTVTVVTIQTYQP